MKVTILGTGAYGLALSKILVENKNEVTMWTLFEEEKNELLNTKKSSKLDKYILDDGVNITTNLKESIEFSDLIVIAVPSEFVSNLCKDLSKYIKRDRYICICSKGLENNSCRFIHEIVKHYLKTNNVATISGPTFAVDLVRKVPVGLSLASKSKKTLKIVSDAFCNDHFKLYPISDITGVEICGTIKNILAIASGIIDGMGYPISTQTMFITKSLLDTKRLIYKLGASENTILSYAGFGDILLTCISEKSRNYRFGKLIGEAKKKEEIDKFKSETTLEGINSLKCIYKIVHSKKIKVPIIDTLYDIIFKDESPSKLIQYLMIDNKYDL